MGTKGGSGRKASVAMADDELHDLLASYVCSVGFVSYGTKLDTRKILRFRAFWKACHEKFGGFSLKDAQLKKVLMKLHQEKHSEWKTGLEPGETVKSWVAEMSRRIRLQARHIMQAQVRFPQPPWVTNVFQDGGEVTSCLAAGASSDALVEAPEVAEEQEEEEEEAAYAEEGEEEECQDDPLIKCDAPHDATASLFLYGYCREQGKGYRVPVANPTGPRDYSDRFYVALYGN